jgi:conjugal transfer/entry exclusion protein
VSTLAAVETATALLVVKTSPVTCAHLQELLVFTPSNFKENIHLPEVG